MIFLIHDLPLQAVSTPDRTTQVRRVFDASAKGPRGKSLNEHLEKGPNYINSLPNVLMAWRFDKVAYTGDVRKMFNQVLIHPDDQVFHRFLWRTNESLKPKVYQWKRLNFGDKPAPDIAAGAIITLAKASQDQYPEAAKELRTHVYVDDIGGSRENEDKKASKSRVKSTPFSAKISFKSNSGIKTKRKLIRQWLNGLY